jgi:hypothetical protein
MFDISWIGVQYSWGSQYFIAVLRNSLFNTFPRSYADLRLPLSLSDTHFYAYSFSLRYAFLHIPKLRILLSPWNTHFYASLSPMTFSLISSWKLFKMRNVLTKFKGINIWCPFYVWMLFFTIHPLHKYS